MLNDMLIFSKSYDFLKSLYPVINRFPKSRRFTLGQRLENSALSFLEHVIAANSARDKTPVLEKADLELEKLRIFVRLAHAMRADTFGLRRKLLGYELFETENWPPHQKKQ